MFVLMLNDMRSAHFEDVSPVAKAETGEELVAFMEREKATDPYRSPGANKYSKTFKRGPLEWFNEPAGPGQGIEDIGTRKEWAERGGRDFDKFVGQIPEVP